MKVKIGNLPEGFKVVNGKVVRTMKQGGSINNTLGPMKREDANLEAEKGETALTDLTNDGSFELYNIGGKRHSEGGTPLNLPEQSFVYSDTAKMKLSVEDLKELGIVSKKKMTPAKASKNFQLNKYIEILENPESDKIAIQTAEDMINKNKIKLSHIAFLQEKIKQFADGVPLAAYPYMIENGINPQQFEQELQQSQAPNQQAMATGPGMDQLQQFTGGPQMQNGGTLPKFQGPDKSEVKAYTNAFTQGDAKFKKSDTKEILNYFIDQGINLDTDTIISSSQFVPSHYGRTNFLNMNVRQGEVQDGTNTTPILENQEFTDRNGNSYYMNAYKKNEGGALTKAEDGGSHTMPDGTVHPGATHEDYLAMMGQPKIGSYEYGAEYAMGGQPFEENPLKRFTDGGGMQMATQDGKLSDDQAALQNIMAYRSQLMQEYEGTASYVEANPNVLADPEKAAELEASIRQMESQLREIDIQTQSIQQSMLQKSLQVDPFAGMQGVGQPQQQQQPPMMAKYGKELYKAQDGLEGQDAWGYQGTDAEGNPIIGHQENAYNTYEEYEAAGGAGQTAHGQAFDIMASKDFDPVRKLWINKYKETAAGNEAGKTRWVTNKADGTPYTDAELFHTFNRMNSYLSAVNAGEGSGDIFGADASGNTDNLAKKYGYGDKKPTEEEIRIFQGMYTSLNNAKITDDTGLLDQINTTPIGKSQSYTAADIKALKKNNKWTNQKAGDPKMVDELGNNVSYVDGALGWTTGGQHYKAENANESSSSTTITEDECDAETRARIMEECKQKKMNFDQATCSCVAKPGEFKTPKTPLYETFPQDDLLVASKSAQLAGLSQINPTLEPSVDPTLMNPMYVDPRQQLSVIESTAAEAIRANPDQATAIMGKMQDASEGIINKHENLNTKIYNNAQAINVPLINDAAEKNAGKFKSFMDESNAAEENFAVGRMELTDNLVNSVNDQMSNADQQYMENLKNPQFWYSPQAHNIEYYNEKGLDGTTGQPISESMSAYEEYKLLADKDQAFADKYFDKIYKPKKNKAEEVNITRENEQVRFGKETSREKDLLRSKRELRKWILGYK